MRFRNSQLRTKVAALLLSLAALWAFAAWVTVREGVNLLWVASLDKGVGQPSNALVTELQAERRLSMINLGSQGWQRRAELDAQRVRTDKARTVLEDRVRGSGVQRAASKTLKQRLNTAAGRLRALDATRQAIDSGAEDRGQAGVAYTQAIDAIFRIYDSLATLDDKSFAQDTRTLIKVNQAGEILSQEDALLSGVLAARRFGPAEHTQFVQLVGAQRYSQAHAAADLQDADPAALAQLTGSPAFTRLRALEDTVVKRGRDGAVPPLSAAQWQNAADPALADTRQVVKTAGARLVDRAQPIAIGVIARLVLAAGLGLVAVIASIVLSITTARALIRQLERLRVAAWELANERLPGVVERLGRGESVDVAAEAPPLSFGSDAIGQVGEAFNAVQQTAIRVAVEQAELRRGFRDTLLSLARRTQGLVHRQLTMLDTMERREIDATELEDLFRVDHLATRMRRNAENLIVLSGATPARGWRRSVAMVDVVRAAVAEVEDYTRVTVLPFGPVALTGRAVGDVTHLLAELIENAVSFSPPYTEVQVGGHMAASGFAIEVEDRGLGMTDEDLAAINQRASDPPDFHPSSSVHLGLFVVSRLAERYGIRVELKRSAYGGTTAVVLIPRELVLDEAEAPVPATVGAPGAPAEAVAAPPVAAVPALEPALPPRTEPEPAITENVLPEPEDPRPVPELSHTPSGLPFRVPQASLAPPLRNGKPAAESRPDDEDPGRSPEEIRRIVGSYQRGTLRGRFEAGDLDAAPDDTANDDRPSA
ncbi:nitrate- and nitrite sensing domain-containing protein [Actinomadura scrupuli]|uniref:sensor histidine kinase n=1 Tax=Actinomadura scrupuli TaxID=559629 RepID=UPI003D99802B